jgi:hypothetical protein
MSESVTIHGDFNGTLNVGGDPVQQKVDEQNQYIADVVWMGSIYRMKLRAKESLRLPTTQELSRTTSRRISWSNCSENLSS